MNAMHAAEALLDILVAGVAGVNAAIAATGYEVKLDEGIARDDTSPYRYVKLGDRLKLADGLTVCFVPGASRRASYLAPDTSEKEVTVTIVAYLVNEHDPHGREMARGAVADALRSLYNRTGNRVIETAHGTLYDGEAGEESFRYMERLGESKMGQVAAAVILPWRGLTYIEETETDG